MFEAFDLAYGFSTELGTGDGGNDFLHLRFFTALTELLELEDELEEDELEEDEELELDLEDAVGDSFNGFLTVYEKNINISVP